MPVTINSVVYNSIATGLTNSVPVNGVYYGVKPFGFPPRYSAIVYDRRRVKIPGVSWQGRKDFGALLSVIECPLCVVDSVGSLSGRIDTLMTSINQLARYSITLQTGKTIPGCVLDNPDVTPTTFDEFVGKVIHVYPFVFCQLSDAN